MVNYAILDTTYIPDMNEITNIIIVHNTAITKMLCEVPQITEFINSTNDCHIEYITPVNSNTFQHTAADVMVTDQTAEISTCVVISSRTENYSQTHFPSIELIDSMSKRSTLPREYAPTLITDHHCRININEVLHNHEYVND